MGRNVYTDHFSALCLASGLDCVTSGDFCMISTLFFPIEYVFSFLIASRVACLCSKL